MCSPPKHLLTYMGFPAHAELCAAVVTLLIWSYFCISAWAALTAVYIYPKAIKKTPFYLSFLHSFEVNKVVLPLPCMLPILAIIQESFVMGISIIKTEELKQSTIVRLFPSWLQQIFFWVLKDICRRNSKKWGEKGPFMSYNLKWRFSVERFGFMKSSSIEVSWEGSVSC